MKYTSIGGQAVMEGVMMRSAKSMVMSVRRSDGTIAVEKQTLSQAPWRKKVAKIPLVRGVVSFVDSLVSGMDITSKSAEMYGEDMLEGEEPSKFEKWISKTFHIKLETVVIVVALILGLGLSFLLFMYLPSKINQLIWWLLGKNAITRETAGFGLRLCIDLIEGLVKILIFICYILAISLMKDIKRLFMYHGAEHKVISCYEHGDELTVENARKYSTSHPRCGTSFIFIVMTVSILLIAVADQFLKLDNNALRLLVKLCLLPVVAGISYEILKLLAKSDNIFFRILRAPGMLLQKLTTRQPDDSMLEVSLTSFKNVLYMDGLMEEPVEEVPENPAEEATEETIEETAEEATEEAPAETAADEEGQV